MTLFLLSAQRAPVAGPFPQMGQLWGLGSKSPQCSPEPACKCGAWFHVWVWGQTGGSQQPLHVSLLQDEMAWWWGRSFPLVMGWQRPLFGVGVLLTWTPLLQPRCSQPLAGSSCSGCPVSFSGGSWCMEMSGQLGLDP